MFVTRDDPKLAAVVDMQHRSIELNWSPRNVSECATLSSMRPGVDDEHESLLSNTLRNLAEVGLSVL